MESNVCHILTNGEPLYDAYTTYLLRGAKLWNNLRDNVKSSDSVKVFRKKVVNLLFSDQSTNL